MLHPGESVLLVLCVVLFIFYCCWKAVQCTLLLLLLLLLCKSLYDVVFSGQPLRRGEREPPAGPLPHRRHGEIQGPVSQDL